VVDENAGPFPLQPLGRDEARVPLLERARDPFRELVRLVERRAADDREEHVDPVGATRLHVRPQLELLERVTHEVSDADGEGEAAVRGIKVKEDEVGPVRPVHARIPRVHVDAVHLHHPEERIARVDEREIDEPGAAVARVRAELTCPDPRRHPLRRLLLEEALARDPFAVALHRERTVAEVRDQGRSDPVVVGEELALRDPVLRKEDAVRVRQLYAPARHYPRSTPCRTRFASGPWPGVRHGPSYRARRPTTAAVSRLAKVVATCPSRGC
jgi:hypothetical protein